MKTGLTTHSIAKCLIVSTALLGASLTAQAEKIGNCEVTGTKGSDPIKPTVPGQLTVQTTLPAPAWWNGDSPDAMKDGYEYCMAVDMAYRAGLDKVKVVNVSFDALVAAQTKDFDIALAEVSITDKRKKVVDFSTPYFDSDIGVAIKKGTSYTPETVKDLRIGVMQGTTGASFVDQKLKPKEVKVFADTGALSTALMANQIDAGLHDTSIMLGVASNSHGMVEVPFQYSTGESYGALYPKGSPNEAVFNKMIEDMKKDGTFAALSKTYLADAWGADPAKIPYLKP
ncbi:MULTISPECIES: ABC transporter substrate-binding protein [unclassified Ochrobactrum]|uniref:ABC transporter substrate-binding protein n=1 Tax=unclassified Ochrobactrum TaxID=239106 RepID=UPI0017C5ECB4|nr:polar amino acid transport system substrate-binding protein [Ochrobactrum sp. RH2CCR150]MDH7788552.1 ABC-type amino acid transport substrate-binding protein [Ochrobactrum sp. 19YEA23]